MDSWIVCPCQRSRLPMLKRMLLSLEHPADRVVVVTTLPEPLTYDDLAEYANHLIVSSNPYISQWWNRGLAYVRAFAQRKHEALVISSDNVGTIYSVAVLGAFLRKHNLTMAGPNPWTDHMRIFNDRDERGTHDRVPGGCWMLAGESDLYLDEQFRWWYSDDDLEMQARHCDGAGIVPHTGFVAEPDTPLSEEKLAWAAEDRQKFIAKWGRQPW